MIELHVLIGGECRIYAHDTVYTFHGGLGCQDYEISEYLLETAVTHMADRQQATTGESLYGVYLAALQESENDSY